MSVTFSWNWNWQWAEMRELMYYWFRGDVEGQRRVAYIHHVRTGEATVEMIDGREVYRGYYPPKSMRDHIDV